MITVDEAKQREDNCMGREGTLYTAWTCPAAETVIVIVDYENEPVEGLGVMHQRRVRVDSPNGSTSLIAQSEFR